MKQSLLSAFDTYCLFFMIFSFSLENAGDYGWGLKKYLHLYLEKIKIWLLAELPTGIIQFNG